MAQIISEARYMFDVSDNYIIEGIDGQDVIARTETLSEHFEECDMAGKGQASARAWKKIVIVNNTPSKAEIFKYKLLGKIYDGE